MAAAVQPPIPGIQLEFVAALDRISFSAEQQNAIIETSGCLNIAMLGLI